MDNTLLDESASEAAECVLYPHHALILENWVEILCKIPHGLHYGLHHGLRGLAEALAPTQTHKMITFEQRVLPRSISRKTNSHY